MNFLAAIIVGAHLAGGNTVPAPSISLFVPPPIMQRTGKVTSSLNVSGYALGGQNVEGQFNGGDWSLIATNVNGRFQGILTNQPVGTGNLVVRLNPSTNITFTRATSLGDVWPIAGQSNATGQGTNHSPFTKITFDGFMLGNDYQWGTLSDYTDNATNQIDGVSNDLIIYGSQGNGSAWPYLGTFLATNRNCSQSFVPCALGATVIAQWLPGANHFDRTTLYGSLAYRASTNQQPNGVAGILWYQGEGDVVNGGPYYYTNFVLLSSNIFIDCGCKIIPYLLTTNASATYNTPANIEAINDAMLTAWTNFPQWVGTPADGRNVDMQDTVNGIHNVTPVALSNCASKFFTAITNTFP